MAIKNLRVMNELYPLKFRPIYKEKIWGGEKIRTVLGMDFSPLPNCGEAWVISGYEGNISEVQNGFLAGNDLNELVEVYMGDLLGDRVFEASGNEFPLLIKFVDAREWLSIQVHPDDELAKKRGYDHGKSEMWYILDADPNARLISGFRQEVNRKEYIHRLENKTLSDILNYEEVSRGDVFNMPAGRIHSLGPGVLLAEIQQTSDITYRIYDWDRAGLDGQPRPIHTELALDAIDFKVHKNYRTSYISRPDETCNLVTSPHFITNLIDLAHPLQKNYGELDSFVIYLCVEGNLGIQYETGDEIRLRAGEALLIPAIVDSVALFPAVKTRLLEIYIP
jgi:mannose-6-phosphate isomerase